MRVNVSAQQGAAPAGKFLVLVDEGAFVQDLAAKVRGALAKRGIVGDLVRLDNAYSAHLPEEEPVGDVLRDGEEVVAVLQHPDARARKQAAARDKGDLDALLGVQDDSEDEPYEPVPGPATTFEEDLKQDADDEDAPPIGGFRFANKGPGDWQVTDLTPKFREFVATRFKEVHASAAEPGNTFITVTMRPCAPECARPVHYSIARIDVIEFERLCGRKIQEIRSRIDFFNRCSEALRSLQDNGAAPEDYAPNMLPYVFRADSEFGSLLREADGEQFGQAEGNRPVIILDTSGPPGEALERRTLYTREAMKRMIYSFLVTKSKFNFIKFTPQGQAWRFDCEMAAPAAQRLREAEEFLDALRPVRPTGPRGGGPDLLDAMRHALSYESDSVYLVTSGLSKWVDPERFVSEVRARNLRNVPIHVIGVDVHDMKAELDLRRLAEESQGTFRQKRFDGPPSFSAVEQRRPPLPTPDGERMTIGGQVEVLDIMLGEEEAQSKSWLEEQRCANQLLLVTATQQAVPDPWQARQAALRRAEALAGQAQRPRLQQLLEAKHGAAHQSVPGDAHPVKSAAAALASGLVPDSSHAALRRGGPGPRAASVPRPGAHGAEIRRPSVANPWDRPYLNPVTGVVRVSQLKQATEAAAKGMPTPFPIGSRGAAMARPRSARRGAERR